MFIVTHTPGKVMNFLLIFIFWCQNNSTEFAGHIQIACIREPSPDIMKYFRRRFGYVLNFTVFICYSHSILLHTAFNIVDFLRHNDVVLRGIFPTQPQYIFKL